MFKYLLLLSTFFSSPFLFSQKDVKIGSQVWMSRNLDVSTYRNGDTIYHCNKPDLWNEISEKKIGAWTYYNFDSKLGKKYGKLYNWYAVNDPRGLAPVGYHVPSDNEWDTLEIFLGGEKVAGKKLKSKTEWYKHPRIPTIGEDNSSGFNALPGGHYYTTFSWLTLEGFFWTSTGRSYRKLVADVYYLRKQQASKDLYFSVRCIKD